MSSTRNEPSAPNAPSLSPALEGCGSGDERCDLVAHFTNANIICLQPVTLQWRWPWLEAYMLPPCFPSQTNLFYGPVLPTAARWNNSGEQSLSYPFKMNMNPLFCITNRKFRMVPCQYLLHINIWAWTPPVRSNIFRPQWWRLSNHQVEPSGRRKRWNHSPAPSTAPGPGRIWHTPIWSKDHPKVITGATHPLNLITTSCVVMVKKLQGHLLYIYRPIFMLITWDS